jgi:hypothetical protein
LLSQVHCCDTTYSNETKLRMSYSNCDNISHIDRQKRYWRQIGTFFLSKKKKKKKKTDNKQQPTTTRDDDSNTGVLAFVVTVAAVAVIVVAKRVCVTNVFFDHERYEMHNWCVCVYSWNLSTTTTSRRLQAIRCVVVCCQQTNETTTQCKAKQASDERLIGSMNGALSDYLLSTRHDCLVRCEYVRNHFRFALFRRLSRENSRK